ncbi:MAG: hypothetical protein HFJ53_02205 [Clostridia bacterium]|jgi:hypothetical protein|nr:hypothetical protein [Clostridia bacterium]
MYVSKESVKEKNFLASAKFQNFTYQVDDTDITADEKGRKIVQAGTVYKKDGKAIGLIFADVDVTHGPQPVAVMVEGYVLEERLPAQVSEDDKGTMTGIKFR